MAEVLRNLGDVLSHVGNYAEDNKQTVAVVGGITAAVGLGWYLTRPSNQYKKKPGTFEIGSGAVDRSKVEDEVSYILENLEGSK